MNGISTTKLESIKEAALTLYNKTPNMAPTREFIHDAVKFCLLGSIPAVLGQDRKYGITEKDAILASVFGSLLVAGTAVGIVVTVYCCLKSSTLDEPGLLVSHEDRPVVGHVVIKSIDQDDAPHFRNIFEELPENAPLHEPREPSSYDSTGIQTISIQ